MLGPCLTTTAPEAAPVELFAVDAATLKSEQLPSGLCGFFDRWRHADLRFWGLDRLVTRLRSQCSPPSEVRVENLQSL